MLDLLLRKFVYKNVSEYKKNALILLQDRLKMYWLSYILIGLFITFPLILMSLSLLFLFFTNSYYIWKISIISLIIAYPCLIKKFSNILKRFRLKIYASLYFNKYVIKGKAISKKKTLKI